MKYRNPELRDRLAAEYVMGTLRGRARQRFERLLMEDTLLKRIVWMWEQRLNPITEQIPPQKPNKRVWRAIEKRISPLQAEKSAWWDWLWQGWGLAATAAAIALLVHVKQLPPIPSVPEYVAVFNDQAAKPLWLVSADGKTGQLTVRAVNATAMANKDFELWALPPNGQPPKSLGLLPVAGKRLTRAVPTPAGHLGAAQGLAVSLEPTGGSPTGLPTGPVLYQAQLLSL